MAVSGADLRRTFLIPRMSLIHLTGSFPIGSLMSNPDDLQLVHGADREVTVTELNWSVSIRASRSVTTHLFRDRRRLKHMRGDTTHPGAFRILCRVHSMCRQTVTALVGIVHPHHLPGAHPVHRFGPAQFCRLRWALLLKISLLRSPSILLSICQIGRERDLLRTRLITNPRTRILTEMTPARCPLTPTSGKLALYRPLMGPRHSYS
ncbi:UNVERIFIED_CONTAM: hypothetical protein K2H54_025238 [Gekko kuhli]